MKLHRYISIFTLIFSITLIHGSYAQETRVKHNTFDPIQASKFLDTLSVQLSVATPSYEALEDAIEKFVAKKELAETCVIETENELRDFEKHKNDAFKGQQTKHDIYIGEKRTLLKTHLSECKLIIIRADESIAALSAKAKKLATSELLTVESSILDNVLHLKDLAVLIYSQFDFRKFYLQTGVNTLTFKNSLLLLMFLTIGYATGIHLRKIIHRRITKIREKLENIPSMLYQSTLCVLEEHEIYLIQAFFIAAYFSVTSLGTSILPLGVIISFVVIGFIVYISIIKFLFSPPPPSKSLIKIAPEIEKPLISRLKILGLVLSLAYIVHEALRGQSIPDTALQLPITIFVTIVTFNLISVLWLINRIKKIRARFHSFRAFTNFILSSMLVGILITNWIGLNDLSIYLLSGIAFSLLSISVFLVIHKLLKYFLLTLSGTELSWQKTLRKKLGLKATASIPELIWIRLVMYLVNWTTLLLLLLKIWRLSANDFNSFLNMLFDGFNVGDTHITPARIVLGFMVFAVMILCTRWLKTSLLIREATKSTNKGTIVAFATMLGYVGFTAAFFVGSITAGINFAGLTIIFGALSVGIGFGLQNIVSNFVSGLILLIERPIKVGDRIIVAGIEGHVKDINIRSTRVRSIKQYDVIVPNSELVSSSVTNLMFGDFVGRTSVFVNVKYGSDMKLVRKTLVKAADQHDDVISDSIEVLFKGFGDDGMELQLRCIVSDVDRHVQIQSELHFNVEEALKASGITIPYPQRDLHFKTSFPDNQLPGDIPQKT